LGIQNACTHGAGITEDAGAVEDSGTADETGTSEDADTTDDREALVGKITQKATPFGSGATCW